LKKGRLEKKQEVDIQVKDTSTIRILGSRDKTNQGMNKLTKP
jgi:hypothetical protein